ncbi:SRPBCC domain-containing protein [Spongiivirga sp. MCCC 1A20706]|uniref:SRPBCC family protein n=1 Tax=Spongiivirga sp. MCCC 1A20706 TaxID=3160963 RepID=UPI003977D23D
MTSRKVDTVLAMAVEPQMIISAFTDYELLKRWWGVSKCSISKKTDGIYFLVWQTPNGSIKYVSSGIIDAFNPTNKLKIKNFTYLCEGRPILEGMTLEILVKSQKNGMSEVHLCQDGYQNGEHWDWYYTAVAKAWPEMLNTLKKYLEQ